MSLASEYIFDPIKTAVAALIGGGSAATTAAQLQSELGAGLTALTTDCVAAVMNLVPATANPLKAAILGDVIAGLQAEQAKLTSSAGS